jgi:hypothetical protein
MALTRALAADSLSFDVITTAERESTGVVDKEADNEIMLPPLLEPLPPSGLYHA